MAANTGHQLRALSREFYGYGPSLERKIKPIFRKAAQNIKQDWQDNLRESPYWRNIAKAVSYDDISEDGTIEFEIGTEPSPVPDGKGGSLVAISMGYTARGGGHRTDPIEFLAEESRRLDSQIDLAILELMG